MALISCTECGRKISDKANSCPECGCPIEIILNQQENIVLEEITSYQATQMIINEVRKSKWEAELAEWEFNRSNNDIQEKTRYNIDLFSGNAISKTIEIQEAAKKACDSLYITCQTLINNLDSVCRPLLKYKPDGKALKEMADVIEYLNSKSEIEHNCSFSYDGVNVGTVLEDKYIPSIQNKLIQKFWESKYLDSPYSIEFANKQREEIKERRKYREEEKKRILETQKKEEEYKEKLGLEYKAFYEHIETECQEKISEFTKQLFDEYEIIKKEFVEDIFNYRTQLINQKQLLETDITSFGFFQAKEKKKKKQEINTMELKIQKLSNPQLIDNELSKIRTYINDTVNKYDNEVDQYLTKRFPHRKSDKKVYEKYMQVEKMKNTPCPQYPSTVSVFERINIKR